MGGVMSGAKTCNISETVQDRTKVLWRTRKSHTHFDWYQNQWPWMTLNGQNALLRKKSFYGTHQKILNEDRHKLSAATLRSMILSRNMTLVQIFARVPYRKGAPNDSGVLENGDAQTFPSKFPTLKLTLLYSNTRRDHHSRCFVLALAPDVPASTRLPCLALIYINVPLSTYCKIR